jgi:hypothetical protein
MIPARPPLFVRAVTAFLRCAARSSSITTRSMPQIIAARGGAEVALTMPQSVSDVYTCTIRLTELSGC